MKSPWSTYVQDTKLNSTEREELRARLLAYMEYHPYRVLVPKQVSLMERMLQRVIVARTFAATGMAVLVAIISTPFLAESANPGDLLYAVKTRITEPLQGVTLSTPKEKIEFEMKLLDKRILETKLLVETGTLSVAAEEDLSENIKRHSDEIQKNIEEIATTNTEEAIYAKADLAAELTKTNDIVTAIVSEQSAPSLKKAMEEVKGVAVESATTAATSSQKQVLGHVERELSRAYELRASLEGKLTEEEVGEVARRFGRIEVLLREETMSSTTEASTTSVVMSVEGASIQSSTATTTPSHTPDDILTRIKTLITYLSNTALRQSMPKEEVVIEIAPITATSTSEMLQGTTEASTTLEKATP